MDFRYHKRAVAGLLLMETVFLLWPALEISTGLYALTGLLYFGVTLWFVFGECRWWLYQFAGIAYLTLITSSLLAASFQATLPRFWHHLILAGLWALVLSLHLFVERNFPPPCCPPSQRHPERNYPD